MFIEIFKNRTRTDTKKNTKEKSRKESKRKEKIKQLNVHTKQIKSRPESRKENWKSCGGGK